MARKNSEINPFVKQLIEQNKIKSADDTQDFMKNIFENMSNTLMQAEFEEDIGYDKYDRELRLTVIPKCSRDISDINAHIDEIYGLIFLASQISRITDRVLKR